MAQVKTAWLNILDAAAVTLFGVSEDSSFPLSRLSDRNIGRMFKPASAATMSIKVDQGASPVAVDRLLIPSGHNLSGMTLDIMHSTDDITYTPAVTQWTGAAGLIDKSWAALTKRYWEFTITLPGVIPQIPELFLTSTYSWTRGPSRQGSGPFDPLFNVRSEPDVAGHDRFLVQGSPKRRRPYTLAISEAQKDELLALNSAWAGAKPFWLYDHESNWIFVKLASAIELREIAYQQYSARFDALEVLP